MPLLQGEKAYTSWSLRIYEAFQSRQAGGVYVSVQMEAKTEMHRYRKTWVGTVWIAITWASGMGADLQAQTIGFETAWRNLVNFFFFFKLHEIDTVGFA